jgi:uncharacterized protein (TIGR00725 family)
MEGDDQQDGRMPMVSVFGSNGELASGVSELSEGLGKLILDLGCKVCTGGRGGVMEAVSRGARTSENWTGREIMGILPEEDDRAANPFLDIVIPTGLGLYRNMLVARAGDACIAMAGGAGTLSEIAFAWQIRKPIAVMSASGGWADELAGRHLDKRREEPVVDLPDLDAAEEWLRATLKL